MHSLAKLSLLVAVGCSSSSSTSVPTLHDFEAQIDSLICTSRFQCCTPAQAMARDPMKPDAASCTVALDAEIDTTFAKAEAGITSGIFIYDASAGAACIDAAKAAEADCSATLADQPIECAEALVGTLALNAACDGGNPACAPNLFCSASQAGSGTCMATAASGQSCAATPCGSGLACLPTMQCGAPLANGEACMLPEQCSSGLCDFGTMKCASQTVEQAVCS